MRIPMSRRLREVSNGEKRTVYAPSPDPESRPPAVLSVELEADEDVEWIWTHTADGKSVVTGYVITKRTDGPKRRREAPANDRKPLVEEE